MRNFSKALENIRKAIQDQDAEFRREEGLEPRQPKPQPKIPSLKPEPKTSHEDSGGKFAANRFLETSITSEPAPETLSQAAAPEIVEVIPQKDSRHSWLYNEVAKAVQNASGDNPNTKVVAVFVPVVQNGHEFENLPVHETVELPPVNEEDFSIEDEIDIHNAPVTHEPEEDDIDIQDDPVTAAQEPDTQQPDELEEPAPDAQEPDEHADFFLNESKPVRLKKDELPEPEPEQPEELTVPEIPAFTDELPQKPDEPAPAETEPQESAEPEIPEVLSEEPEQAEHLGELIPESMEHPDPELAEAFSTMEEKLDESISAVNEQPEIEEAAEIAEENTPEADTPETEDVSDGETMPFTEIPADEGETLPELVLPDELEDDEIIDEIDESGEDSKAN